jgi:hypothetical protein
MLIGGAQSWLINGAVVLLAIGMEAAAALSACRLVTNDWRVLTHVTAVIIAVVASAAGVNELASQILTGVAGCILIPIWAIWLSRGLRIPEPGTVAT